MIISIRKILENCFGSAAAENPVENTTENPKKKLLTDFSVNGGKNPKIRRHTRLYAIGDIHGKKDLFDQALDRIKADQENRPITEAHIVLLGDYIDRGLESRAVLETIIAQASARSIIPLKGNHEDMLLRALDDEEDFRNWSNLGGIQTIFSYGVKIHDLMVGKGHDKARAALKNAIPEHHVSWLHSLRSQWQYDDFFFCHAGVNPAHSLETQSDEDLLWVRREFLDHRGAFANIIVHGHTPVEAVDFRLNRINLDTGAYYSENLSCIAIDSEGIQIV